MSNCKLLHGAQRKQAGSCGQVLGLHDMWFKWEVSLNHPSQTSYRIREGASSEDGLAPWSPIEGYGLKGRGHREVHWEWGEGVTGPRHVREARDGGVTVWSTVGWGAGGWVASLEGPVGPFEGRQHWVPTLVPAPTDHSCCRQWWPAQIPFSPFLWGSCHFLGQDDKYRVREFHNIPYTEVTHFRLSNSYLKWKYNCLNMRSWCLTSLMCTENLMKAMDYLPKRNCHTFSGQLNTEIYFLFLWSGSMADQVPNS